MKHAFENEEGNRIIDFFMFPSKGEDIYSNSSAKIWDRSWDDIMVVIRKIKECVFSEGYDIFMPEHSSYISIGNACYDADLKGAWVAVVKWIILRMDLQDAEKVARAFLESRKQTRGVDFISRSYHGVGLKVSPHTIVRYKQRIDENATPNEICEIFNKPEIIDAYKKGGDGKYYIDNKLIITIDNHKVITCYKGIFDDNNVLYTKIAELTKKRYANR